MAKLRFEIWESSRSGQCAAVGEAWDRVRDEDATCREVFYASTIEEAMIHYHAVNGWEPYKPIPGLTDLTFTEEQVAEQETYLKIRAKLHPI
jgi:hypothetical protein